MKTLRTSLDEFNAMHPLLAGFTIGLFTVAGYALAIPSGIDRPRAWGVFIAFGAGATVGRLIRARMRQDPTQP